MFPCGNVSLLSLSNAFVLRCTQLSVIGIPLSSVCKFRLECLHELALRSNLDLCIYSQGKCYAYIAGKHILVSLGLNTGFSSISCQAGA